MNIISAFIKRIIVCVIAGVLLLFTGCGLRNQSDAEELSVIDYEEQEDTLEEEEPPQKVYISVFVCGAVNNPGVYELEENARVCDAIQLAGGFREDASEEYLNQARKINDGERITVPTEEEAIELGPESSETSSPDDGKININTATKEDLESLSGIGESRADSIIQYRDNNGKFSSIDELKNVDGIKDGIFDKIKDSIIV